jgi:hypothetical protein
MYFGETAILNIDNIPDISSYELNRLCEFTKKNTIK